MALYPELIGVLPSRSWSAAWVMLARKRVLPLCRNLRPVARVNAELNLCGSTARAGGDRWRGGKYNDDNDHPALNRSEQRPSDR